MYTLVGKIINTHGIQGALKIAPYTDDIKRFSQLDKLFVGEDHTLYNIEKVSYFKNFVLIKLKDFNNINEVLKFKDEFIYILNEDRVVLSEDQYFIADLIGIKVVSTSGKDLGILNDIISNSANDVYVVKNSQGEFLIPAVKEFVKDIDLENKILVLDPIEGMFD